jgi:amino acid adenylation domain-containing protein
LAFLLHHLLSETAAKFPDHQALVCGDDVMTYAELASESSLLAAGLTELGIRRGDRVGIHLNRSIAAIVGLFGILKAGAAYVPIDPTCPPNRLRYILNKCGITFLLASHEKLANIERADPATLPLKSVLVLNSGKRGPGSLGSAAVHYWQDLRDTLHGAAPGVDQIDRDVAYILFTSGSTGNPKGVVLSHVNSLTFVNTAHEFFGITARDRLSNICPLHFDMSVFDLFVAVKAGAAVIIIPETAAMFPAKLAEIIEKGRISVWNSVPSALCFLAAYKNLDSHDLSSLRLVLFAGEQFPLKHLRRIREAVPGARLCNMYGQTEANSSTHYWVDRLPVDAKATLPIGRSLPNFDVFALDEQGRQVTAPGEEGELYVRASTVALGYWDEGEKTEKSFVTNPLRPELNERVYRTGDVVSLDSEGNYLFLGRKDHMIKSRGYRIEIGEIETVLCNHPAIANAVVIPIPDELIGNKLSALVVPQAAQQITREALLTYCATHLPKYMIPEIIEFRQALPTTSSGKIDRKLLSQPLDTAPREDLSS